MVPSTSSSSSAVKGLTFPSYESASLRRLLTTTIAKDDDVFPLYSSTNIAPVISSLLRLTCLLLSPYVIAPAIVLILTSSTLPTIALAVFVIALANISVYLIATPASHVTDREGFNPVGATTLPDLYYAKASPSIKTLLEKCPLLTSKEAIQGGLPGLSATPWIFSGDMRTLFPFLAFKPTPVAYVRRWVRVPLADGPLEQMVHEDPSNCEGTNGRYEAVALDCAFAPTQPTIDEPDRRAQYSLLILAGLTGGSNEGYVLDLVSSANRQGIDCYVMLGRGLGGTPNLSDAAFHGARTSDLRECARVLRRAIPVHTKLCVVGISMGGIIVINAVARGVLAGLADGAVSVSGCFDTTKNINYTHSRTIWQPVLAHGLKTSFVAPPGALTKMKRRMDAQAAYVVEKVSDVIEFDSMVVTALHRFRDVYHYYNDMCGGKESHLLAMVANDRSNVISRDDVNEVPLVSLDEVARDVLLANTAEAEANQTGDSEWVQIAQASPPPSTKAASVALAPGDMCGLPLPLLALNAADDPIIHVDSTPCRSGVVGAVDNLVCLVTTTGGHVGWPLGISPSGHAFKFQNTLILEFARAVAQVADKKD